METHLAITAITVTDNKGLSDSDTMKVLVKNKTLPTISDIIDLEVKKSARNLSRGDTIWYKSLYASSSDIIEFKITIKSKSNIDLENVMVRDKLPSRIIYQGNLKIDGVSDSRNISSGAINIGTLSPEESKTITFLAKVTAGDTFSYGITNLINTVLVYNNQISKTATAKVIVRKQGVAGISTGITNNFFLDSILFPLMVASLLVWLFRSKFIALDKIIEERKREIIKYRADRKFKKLIERVGNKA